VADEPDHRQKVEECREIARKLFSEWECDFLDSVAVWTGEFTPKQKAIIDQLYKKACASPY
jgi:hypothetical protein